MAKAPAYQIYPGDILRSPDLRKCSWETRGIWWDILCLMWFEKEQGKMSGTREELCRLIGCTNDELGRFLSASKAHRFCNVTFRNGNVTLINRRMHREFLQRNATKNRVSRFRKKRCNAKVTSYSPSPTPSPVTRALQNSIDYKSVTQPKTTPAITHTFTLEDFQNEAVLIGLTDAEAESCFTNYKSLKFCYQGKSDMPILSATDALKRWKMNRPNFHGRSNNKQNRSTEDMLAKLEADGRFT